MQKDKKNCDNGISYIYNKITSISYLSQSELPNFIFKETFTHQYTKCLMKKSHSRTTILLFKKKGAPM